MDLTKLKKHYSEMLIQKLETLFKSGETFCLTPESLVQEYPEHTPDEALKLLIAVVSKGYLSASVKYKCPNSDCVNSDLTEDEANNELCPHCDHAFCDYDGGVVKEFIFYFKGHQKRDVRWFLALHGMNTRGGWQEDFNWLISKTYSRGVPVAIYKYGIIRFGAVIRFRQKNLTEKLIQRINRLKGETEESGFGGEPDVIAHSFGTWLLGHALLYDQNIKLGRVILTGSILRPNFNWDLIMKRQQVEAVLNHYSTKDFWAGKTQYFIPDSGPSGKSGFDNKQVINICEDFKHSDYFVPENMKRLFNEKWQPFLTKNISELCQLRKNDSPSKK